MWTEKEYVESMMALQGSTLLLVISLAVLKEHTAMATTDSEYTVHIRLFSSQGEC